MTINNAQQYVDNLPDWAMLDGCFGTQIRPTDIDGFVERKGKFLYLEWKKTTARTTDGQKLAIQRRVEDGVSTYVIIHGEVKTREITGIKIHYPGGETREIPASLENLRALCCRWFAWADQN